ncbi:hypothetical protein PoB_005021500 [Plakobranchus ocellatus]|uniref:Uncharacterized protein n=1 Tax=Plakobranchus ocellatus TaxID=259542 RepID=A0AAV4BTC5_9GAST|nr:hypothetical protein PoB_005021500 [Plakobranchus ocellatus]
MKDAMTVEEYTSLKAQLTEVSSQPIVAYFEANWFSKPERLTGRMEWASFMLQPPTTFAVLDKWQGHLRTNTELWSYYPKKICSCMSLLGDQDFEDKYLQLTSLFSPWRGDFVDVPGFPSTLVCDSLSLPLDVFSAPLHQDDLSQPHDAPSFVPLLQDGVSRTLDAPSSKALSASSSDPAPSFSQVVLQPMRVKGRPNSQNIFRLSQVAKGKPEV